MGVPVERALQTPAAACEPGLSLDAALFPDGCRASRCDSMSRRCNTTPAVTIERGLMPASAVHAGRTHKPLGCAIYSGAMVQVPENWTPLSMNISGDCREPFTRAGM